MVFFVSFKVKKSSKKSLQINAWCRNDTVQLRKRSILGEIENFKSIHSSQTPIPHSYCCYDRQALAFISFGSRSAWWHGFFIYINESYSVENLNFNFWSNSFIRQDRTEKTPSVRLISGLRWTKTTYKWAKIRRASEQMHQIILFFYFFAKNKKSTNTLN